MLDHDVTLPSGETVHNAMRVLADDSGSEIVFSLRRQPGMSDADFDRDADAVLATSPHSSTSWSARDERRQQPVTQAEIR